MPTLVMANSEKCMKLYNTTPKIILNYFHNLSFMNKLEDSNEFYYTPEFKLSVNGIEREIKPGDVVKLKPWYGSWPPPADGLVHSIIKSEGRVVGAYLKYRHQFYRGGSVKHSEELSLVWLSDFNPQDSFILKSSASTASRADSIIDIKSLKLPEESGNFRLPFGNKFAPVSVGDVLQKSSAPGVNYQPLSNFVVTGFTRSAKGEVQEIVGVEIPLEVLRNKEYGTLSVIHKVEYGDNGKPISVLFHGDSAINKGNIKREFLSNRPEIRIKLTDIILEQGSKNGGSIYLSFNDYLGQLITKDAPVGGEGFFVPDTARNPKSGVRFDSALVLENNSLVEKPSSVNVTNKPSEGADKPSFFDYKPPKYVGETERERFIREWVGDWVDSPGHGLQKYQEAEREWARRNGGW